MALFRLLAQIVFSDAAHWIRSAVTRLVYLRTCILQCSCMRKGGNLFTFLRSLPADLYLRLYLAITSSNLNGREEHSNYYSGHSLSYIKTLHGGRSSTTLPFLYISS